MRTLTLLAALGIGHMTTAGSADACKGYRDTETVSVETVEVKALARLLGKKAKVAVFDANGLATRSKYGMIPGARLLSHYKNFALNELPASKNSKLVFYCGGSRCTAAEKSAQRAVEAGYTDVSVLVGGIQAWSGAGQQTSAVPAS